MNTKVNFGPRFVKRGESRRESLCSCVSLCAGGPVTSLSGSIINITGTGTQARCPITRQSVDCKHRHAEKDKQRAHWDVWGSQYVYKYLMHNPANWGSGGIFTGPTVLPISANSEHVDFLLQGKGLVESSREPRASKGWEKQKGTSRSFCDSKQISPASPPRWDVKCYFCIIT